MTTSAIDKSQSNAAKIAGLAFPISFVTVVAVNFGIFARLIVSGNPAETSRNTSSNDRPWSPSRKIQAGTAVVEGHLHESIRLSQLWVARCSQV